MFFHAFGRLLEQLRSERGLTQEDLGRLLGHRDGSVVSKWERGDRLPRARTVADLERKLEVPAGTLMTARHETLEGRQREEMGLDAEADQQREHSLAYDGRPLTAEEEELMRALIARIQRGGSIGGEADR